MTAFLRFKYLLCPSVIFTSWSIALGLRERLQKGFSQIVMQGWHSNLSKSSSLTN